MKIYARLMSKTFLTLFAMGMSLISGNAMASFPSAPYFPLPVSASWQYQVLDETLTLTGTATITRNPTLVTIPSGSGVPTTELDTSSTIPAPVNGAMSYFTSDGSGIRLHRRFTPKAVTVPLVGVQDFTLTFSPPVILANGTTDILDIANTNGVVQVQLQPDLGTSSTSPPYTASFTVNGFESVTVPAGTFDTLKISGTIHLVGILTFGFFGSREIDQTLAFTLYLAQNIGPVKTVSTVTDNIAIPPTSSTSTSVLTGTNLLLPNVTPSPGTYGNVAIGGTSDKIFTVQNTGPATLNLSANLAPGGGEFAIISGEGAFSLAPGVSTTVPVRFAPTSPGAQSATLQVTNSDYPGVNPKNVPLSGTGATHTLTIESGPSGDAPTGVASGGPVSLTVTAIDSLSHTLTYSWSVLSCSGLSSNGIFSSTTSPTPTWTAPVNATGDPKTCTIQVAVNDGILPALLGTYDQTVNSASSLTVSTTGSGTGSVTSSVGGINCAANAGTCSAMIATGAGVTLTATPTGGSTFAGWGGDCAGTTVTCNLTMDSAKTASATFNPPSSFSLNVTAAGSGTGSVTSSVGGINCGVGNTGTCSTMIANGASVTLTATPTGGATFGGWGSNCAASGFTPTCLLTMTAAKTVSATFTAPPPPGSFNLNVTAAGSGTGSVASSVGGITCGVGNSGTCATSLTSGSGVTLTAAATGGATFAGWGDDCTSFGTGAACNLTMDSAKTASAMFTPTAATGRQLMDVMTLSGPGGSEQRAFLTTDPITAGATYYDPADACAGGDPATLKFFVFNLEGQLLLGLNRDTTGGVTSTPVAVGSKYHLLRADLASSALAPGAYNLVFRVEDCTATSVLVSEFYSIRVLAP